MQKAQQSRSSVVNIVIAEANHMNCQLVESAFRPRRKQVFVIASAVDSTRALALLKEVEPDVAIYQRAVEGRSARGLPCASRITCPADADTGHHAAGDSREREFVLDAFRCGAHGVIFRDEPLDTLSKCIHAVHKGQVWASSQHLGYLLEAVGRTLPVRLQDTRGRGLLTKREKDVVRLLAEGLTNRDIASQLKLSEHTVRNYLFRVFDKLAVSTRVELVLYCLQERHNGAAPE